MRRSLIYLSLVLFAGILAIVCIRAERAPEPTPEALRMQGTKKIVVLKSKRRLELYSDGGLVRRYRIGLGSRPVGDKQIKGDRKTPEGTFHICVRNDRSAYYLSLGIDYPGIEDARRGLRNKLIDRETHDRIVAAINAGETPPQNTALGGDIYIHGNGSHRDWTWGCVALDDRDMKELFDVVPLGTEVVIKK
jgi:murein L,D-transpeptidase YafK